MNYDVFYEFLNYQKLEKRLNNILNNKQNKFKVIKHDPIGYTSCNFPIEHFSIGHGSKHIIYFAGVHGNEIIGVDFVTTLMHNLALGKEDFKSFKESVYTIHFLPLINPEGFYTTTYALTSITDSFNNEELENFCYKYFLSYKNDDILIKNMNDLLKDICKRINILDHSEDIINNFWHYFRNYEIINKNNIINFFKLYEIDKEILENFLDELILKYFKSSLIKLSKEHQNIFKNITLDVIPQINENHQLLKEKLLDIYKNNDFPISTLANFYANSNGVNLNDNNLYYYEIFKNRLTKEKEIYAKGRENNILISIKSPLGMPNYDMHEPFTYEKENLALLNFFDSLKNNYYLSFNCHGTGGLLYTYPIYNKEFDNEPIALKYVNKINEIYKNILNEDITYNIMPKGKLITGMGDVLREKYPRAYLLELSKMGGNPIGPYGDLTNYKLTMIANMTSLMNIL